MPPASGRDSRSRSPSALPAAKRAKRAKDLDQAASLMEALRLHDPFALEDALEDARAHGRKGWKELIDRSLAELEARD